MKGSRLIFNPPPGWPQPPEGWQPPADWTPDPSWPKLPKDWQLWLPNTSTKPQVASKESSAKNSQSTTDNNSGSISGETYIETRLAFLEAENAALHRQISNSGKNYDELIELDDERILQSVGIYRYHHPLENAVAYKSRLDNLGSEVLALVKSEQAIEKSNLFTFDNSLAKGRRMTTDLGKLMLRAYNAEADNSIRSLRAGNIVTARKRLEASRNSIAKLGVMMEMRISDRYHALRLEEIELTADWLMKKQEEKEDAREERARLREERRVERELAEERNRLIKERAHLQNAILALEKSGGHDPELDGKLVAIDAAIERNDFRLANIRAGYVYVISNRGAFGPNIIKIGLTRRLEPLDRIRELSGASVPFRFDVHALFFSEDAVSLENDLHKQFSDRAVNMANSRKEFFFVTPVDVRAALIDKVGNLLEFNENAEAIEYLQSMQSWPHTEHQPGPNQPDPRLVLDDTHRQGPEIVEF